MQSGKRTLRWVGVACLVVAALLVLSLFRPVRVQYHKWRLAAAKREHLRLGHGEYRFYDKMRELLLARPVTWEQVRSSWRYHEQRLVDLGFLHRREYYARRSQVPTRADPDFARALDQMEKACPWWSFAASESGISLTITATKEGLELWKTLAPPLKLQEDKPTKEGCRHHKCRRHRSRCQSPASLDWLALFDRPLADS